MVQARAWVHDGSLDERQGLALTLKRSASIKDEVGASAPENPRAYREFRSEALARS